MRLRPAKEVNEFETAAILHSALVMPFDGFDFWISFHFAAAVSRSAGFDTL